MRIIVPKLRFKEFNDEFTRYNLEDVSFIIDGTHQTPNYKKRGIRFISVEDIENIYNSRKFISELDYEKNFNIKPKCNDIFMTRITAGVIGATAIKKDNEPLAFYVSLALIRPNNMNTKYLNYYINSPYFRHELFKKIIHVAFPKKINLNDIGKCKIALPQIKEQEKIGNLFELLDKKIELQKQKIEVLKLYNESLKKQILKKVYRFIEFKGFWKIDLIGNICNIQTGKSNTQDKDDNGIYPFYIRSDKIELSNKYIFDCEAVLTIGDGNIGKVFFYENGKFDCHQRVYVLNNIKIYGKYLYYYFSTFFYKRALSMSAKNTVDSVRQDMITKMRIEIPPINEQIKISSLLDLISEKIIISENKLINFRNYKKFLLQQMFI